MERKDEREDVPALEVTVHTPHNFRNISLFGLLLALASSSPVAVEVQSSADVPSTDAAKAPVAVYITRADDKGAVLELDDLKSSPRTVIGGLQSPMDVVRGPDGRLYFNEISADGGQLNRILRVEADGSNRTIIAEWPGNVLWPSGMVFAPNGDLYFGTVSLSEGGPTSGVWRISRAAYAPQHIDPKLVIAGERFSSVPPGDRAAVTPCAFLSKGDLLLVDNPRTMGATHADGRILVAEWPDYNSLREFIRPSERAPSEPAGLVVNTDGDIFVTEFAGGKVLRYSAEGTFKGEFATLDHPNQIAISDSDTVYVTNGVFKAEGGMIEGGLYVYSPGGALVGSVSPDWFLRGVTVGPPRPPVSANKLSERPERPPPASEGGGMATIIAAVIGLIGTIGAAIIAKQSGKKKGIEEGRRHSIQKFLDAQKKQLDRAEAAIKRRDHVELRAIATAIVDNTKQWRKIQENFRALLNGRVDDLSGMLATGTPEQLAGTILALKEGYEGRALAVETELKKSAI